MAGRLPCEGRAVVTPSRALARRSRPRNRPRRRRQRSASVRGGAEGPITIRPAPNGRSRRESRRTRGAGFDDSGITERSSRIRRGSVRTWLPRHGFRRITRGPCRFNRRQGPRRISPGGPDEQWPSRRGRSVEAPAARSPAPPRGSSFAGGSSSSAPAKDRDAAECRSSPSDTRTRWSARASSAGVEQATQNRPRNVTIGACSLRRIDRGHDRRRP
jgi:hypothetical protein